MFSICTDPFWQYSIQARGQEERDISMARKRFLVHTSPWHTSFLSGVYVCFCMGCGDPSYPKRYSPELHVRRKERQYSSRVLQQFCIYSVILREEQLSVLRKIHRKTLQTSLPCEKGPYFGSRSIKRRTEDNELEQWLDKSDSCSTYVSCTWWLQTSSSVQIRKCRSQYSAERRVRTSPRIG